MLTTRALRIIQQGGSKFSKYMIQTERFSHSRFKRKGLSNFNYWGITTRVKKRRHKDFKSILKDEGLYDPNKHNKTNLTYEIGTSIIEVFSAYDDKMSRHGKRAYSLL